MEWFTVIAILAAILLIVLYAFGVRKSVHFAWLGVAVYLVVLLVTAVRAVAG